MWDGFSDPNSGDWQWSDRGRPSASLNSPREREPIPMQFHGASELTTAPPTRTEPSGSDSGPDLQRRECIR